jgi:hypothetical protein
LRLSDGQFDGKPFKLHPSQAFKLGSIFGWKKADGTRRFRTVYIEEGKGNGKSPFAGGVGLYGLTADGEAGAQIYAAAAKKDQAQILFQDACKMVRQAPALNERLKFSGGLGKEFNVAHHKSQSFFRPISKEAGKTGSGPRPHFALCDEVHEHPDRSIMEMLQRGFKFRQNPLLLMITNSGSDRNSVCWEERERAVKVVAGTQTPDEDFTFVGEAWEGSDSVFAYICGLDKDDDPMTDPSCWVKANPLLGTILATAPNGTGANIADGTVLWTYAGPNDGPATAPSWLGKMRKYLRQVKAALPGVKLIGVTCPPDSTSTANTSAYNYDSGTGALTLTIPDASKLSVGGNVRITGLTPSGLNTSGIANTPITAINGNDITVTRPTGLAAPTGTAAVGLTWTDPSYQTPKSGYTTATSFRSWANRCIRTNPNGVLPYGGIADIGKWAESGNPTTPVTETGKWDKLLTGGVSLGSKMTSDGTHPTSFGNDYLATQMATQEPALAALLLAA